MSIVSYASFLDFKLYRIAVSTYCYINTPHTIVLLLEKHLINSQIPYTATPLLRLSFSNSIQRQTDRRRFILSSSFMCLLLACRNQILEEKVLTQIWYHVHLHYFAFICSFLLKLTSPLYINGRGINPDKSVP